MSSVVKVEIEGNITNTNATREFIEEIEHQYADLAVSNINISSNKVTFDIASPGMEDLTSDDIKFRINEFLSMNVPPFTVKSVNVSGGSAKKPSTVTIKSKTLKVEIEGNITNTNATREFIEEIEHQYADLAVSNINISSNKVTFDIASPGMEDLTSDDIKFRINEFLSMNVPPFTVKSVNVR